MAIAVAILVGACQYDPYAGLYATVAPDRGDIVGVWIPTESTSGELSRSTVYSEAMPRIEVDENGVIRMKDIPDTWRDPSGEGAGKLEDFIGKWEMSKRLNQWWGLDLTRDQWGCSGCLMIMGDQMPYTLVIRYGDPDAGLGYEFRKAD